MYVILLLVFGNKGINAMFNVNKTVNNWIIFMKENKDYPVFKTKLDLLNRNDLKFRLNDIFTKYKKAGKMFIYIIVELLKALMYTITFILLFIFCFINIFINIFKYIKHIIICKAIKNHPEYNNIIK